MTATLCEHPSARIDRQVASLLAECGVLAPPIDAFQVAAHLDLAVFQDDRQAGRARLSRTPSPTESAACIFLAADPRGERRQWAVAHEIGEFLAPQLVASLAVDPGEDPHARESLANSFATRLLLPQHWFQSAGRRCGWELFTLKHVFATASHELIAQRMLEATPQAIISVFDQDRLTWRRRGGFRPPPLAAFETACRLAASQQGQPTRLQVDEALVRAWPIHEPGWRREILRTEPREAF